MPELLWMLLPLILVPLCMRFAAVRLILLMARRRLLPGRLREMEAGWEEEERESFIAAEKIVRTRLRTLFPPAYDLTADVREILLSIQRQRGETGGELRFSFSIRSAAEVGLLAFADIYDDLHRKPLFRLLQRIRLKWLVRVGKLAEGYARIRNLPVLRELSRSRILGLLLRAALIPLLGLPLLIFYLVRSFLTGILADGSFRYLYALVLLRITYYGIYLYGGENPVIAGRISDLGRDEITDAGRRLEKQLLPREWGTKSLQYEEGVLRLRAILRDLGIDDDHRLSEGEGQLPRPFASGRRLFRRLRGSALLAARRSFLKVEKPTGIVAGLKLLWTGVSGAYVPGDRKASQELRVGELAAAGYFASLLLLSKLYSAPGGRRALGRVPVELAVRINTLTEDELFRTILSGAREGMRLAGVAGRIRRAGLLLRGRYHPAGIVLSFATPFALAHLENSLKSGLYHRAGRLMLYIWEQNAGNTLPPLEEYLVASLR
jgi:hypothetical protein